MPLQFVAMDPDTDTENCPTVWVDDDGSFVIQGWKVNEATTAECLQTGKIPETEAVIRLPARMAAALREACNATERATVL